MLPAQRLTAHTHSWQKAVQLLEAKQLRGNTGSTTALKLDVLVNVCYKLEEKKKSWLRPPSACLPEWLNTHKRHLKQIPTQHRRFAFKGTAV